MTSSTTIKFPESTSKYGQGDTVEMHRHTETQIIRLRHVTRRLLEAEEWPSSLFDCASPHSSGFHMFAALDPIFGKIQWKTHVTSRCYLQKKQTVQYRLIRYYHFFVPVVAGLFCVLQSEFNWLQLCQFALPTMPPLGLRWMISSLTSGRQLKRNTFCWTPRFHHMFSMFSPYQGDNKPSYMTARFQGFNVGDNFTWKKLIGIQLCNYIQKKHVETLWEVARLVYWAASSWMASKKECPSLSFAST